MAFDKSGGFFVTNEQPDYHPQPSASLPRLSIAIVLVLKKLVRAARRTL
jgi:hypothetical protein